MTQEFHISITPIRADEFLVRTEEVAPGVPLAEEQFVWPTLEWLTQARQLMNDPIVGLLRGDRPNPPGTPSGQATSGLGATEGAMSNLVSLGQQLYSGLFQGRLRDSWMTAQGIAQHRGEALRFRLGLKGSHLPCLPWEVMNGGVNEGFQVATRHLTTGVDVLFSRYLADAGFGGAMPYLAVPKPEKTVTVLMAIAAPTDQQQLKLKQEAYHLQEELRLKANVLQSAIADRLPDIRVTILEQPGREELAQALEQGQYNMFHFAGHSDLGSAGGQLYLVNRQTGLSETLSGNDLAGLLLNNNIQMAVFNSCRGAYTATAASQAQDGNTLTEALVNRGIPAVLAMAEQIPDDVALSLTRLFYRNLKQDYPVDLSLNRARQGLLSAYSSDQLYWALPTLYMHPDFDGYLTAGDRTLDNPADSLIRLPHLYASPLNDAVASASRPQAITPDSPPDRTPTITPIVGDPLTIEESSVQPSIYANTPTQEDIQTPDPAEHPAENSTVAAVNASTWDDHSHDDAPSDDYVLPQDAPVLSENLELPDDFFLSGEDINALDSALDDDDDRLDEGNYPRVDGTIDEDETDSDSLDELINVRDLVEQLEDSGTHPRSQNGAIATTDGTNSIQANTLFSASAYSVRADISAHPSYSADPEASESHGYQSTSSDDDELSIANSDMDMVVSDPEGVDVNSGTHQDAHPHYSTGAIQPSTTHATTQSVAYGENTDSQLTVSRSPHEISTPPDPLSFDPALLRHGRSPWRKAVWVPLASIVGAAIVFLGYRVVPELQPPANPEDIVVVPENVTRTNLPDVSTRQVTEYGIGSFVNDRAADDGQAAIEELLNRGDLEAAATVLDSVPKDDANAPVISFLYGRLAWQSVDEKDTTFFVEDVKDFWSYAAQKSGQPLHYNALGFALYEEGRFEEAIEAWETALNNLGESGISVIPEDNNQNLSSPGSNQIQVGIPQRPLTNQDALTAYAGIALAMAQLSASSSAEQPYELLNQAVQIRQVVSQSPKGLNPHDSEHYWLWTEGLIQEWEIFKGVHSQ